MHSSNSIYHRNVLVGILVVHYVERSHLFTKRSIPFYILTALVSSTIIIIVVCIHNGKISQINFIFLRSSPMFRSAQLY